MKTKNIFRMLLVAVTLLLGANNVMAEEIVFYENASGIGGSNPSYDIKDTRFADVQPGNILHIEYDIQVFDWGPTYKLYLYGCYGTTKIYEAVVTEGGSADIVLTSEDIASFFDRSNNYDPGRYAVVAGEWILIKKVSLIINGSVKQDTSMSFDQESFTLKFGETFTAPTLTTTPENLTVTWSSSNERCAMVSNGEVTIVGAGTAKITASFAGDDSYKKSSASYTITVNKGTPVLSFPEESYTATLGEEFTPPTLNNPDNVSVYYYMNNTYPAEVNRETGAITLKNEGETEVYAKFNGDDNWEQAETSYKLIVRAGEQPQKQDVTLSFDPTVVYATAGDANITKPTLISSVDGLTIYYYSSNTNVATVDSNTGDVTLTGQPGVATISAQFNGDNSYNGAYTTYTLVVKTAFAGTTEGETLWTGSAYFGNWHNPYGEWAEVNATTFNVGDEIRFYGVVESLSGDYWQLQVNYNDDGWKEITSLSGNGFANGYTSLLVSEDNIDNLNNKTLYIQGNNLTLYYVTVIRQTTKARVNMSFTPASVELTLGDEFTAPTLSIKDAEGNDVTGLTITYSSSNGNLATVATDGTVTLIENVTGSTTITATFMGDNTYEAASAQYTITVNNPEAPGFTITISPTTHGTVTADAESAAEGTLVTLTISPNSGYELDAISVKDAYDTDVQVNMTNYTFTMPASNVTVTATFKQTGSGPVEPTIPEDIENEHRLWTGPESAEGSDGHVSNLTADLFTDIKTGDTFRVYVSDINNDQNWKLYITDNVNGWNSQVFEGFTGGDILRNNGGSAYYHAEDGYGYFEFTCTDQSVANFKNNGTQMSFQWMTITKVTYISNNTTPTQKTHFSFSFSQSTVDVTYGVNTFTGQYPSANKQLGDEVWNHLSWESSNTNVAEVNNVGEVTIKGLGTTNITVSFAGNDNYYPATESYTLIVQPNVRRANIETSGYATFSCDVALDFYGITSLRAYIAKSINANWVVLQQVTGTVAANTGLVIVGTTTDIPVVDSGSSFSDNLLVPGTGGTVGGAGIYVLTNESGTVKFADTSAHSATVPVGKAYLQAPGTSAARLNIRWEGDATGIKALKSDFNSDDVIFDLKGQRVITPSKGLYIINGQKVVIK